MIDFNHYLNHSYSYSEYHQLIVSLLQEGKTTGDDHSQFMVDYTRLNHKRMLRIDKKGSLDPALLANIGRLTKKQQWIIITEAWCGDAAQNIPYLELISSKSSMVSTHYVLRDQFPELIDQFLTNGGRAIPKLIALDASTHELLGQWGPRPEAIQKMMLQEKENPSMSRDQLIEWVHGWYAKDKGHHLMEEMLKFLEGIETIER
ncbi:MAG: thioredoxin family protein [Cyclobacteriaceae bacterium]|nr:thioredoxin family protein [Cyclobacteriaceae bacterium]MCH8514724.1 thioredoxin family protein [Cyclobacteriaceae bacterium]